MRTRTGVWVAMVMGVVLLLLVLAGAAVRFWPHATLVPDATALARVHLRDFSGRLASVRVLTAGGARVPVRVRQGRLWPVPKLSAGERLTVEITVRRPGWAGWLVGKNEQRTFAISTPNARLRGRWLLVKSGQPVGVAFDKPVTLVSLHGNRATTLDPPRRLVPVGVIARGSHSAGAVRIAAVARSWERLPRPVRVSWFPARPFPQLLAEPRPGTDLRPDRELRLTFSRPVSDVLGARRPVLSPPTAGRWRLLDDHTLAFQPSGLGFWLGAGVELALPRTVHVAGQAGTNLTRTLGWQVPEGSTLRLQQLLAQLGYLPLDWQPAGDPAPRSVRAQLDAAFAPPPGRFVWRYPNIPPELAALWQPGQSNEITRGAVMMFEEDHGLAVDAIAGRRVWRQLLADVLAGRRRDEGYSYVFVHRSVPQSLNLWHNGQVILSSPGNTGVPAAPTQLGTFPVFEHIPIGTMSGTNPDGSHYNDPGIRYISYFNGGDAIHAFNRASFGTPQSLGCVELPLDAAARVWPYTPIGTLVTIED